MTITAAPPNDLLRTDVLRHVPDRVDRKGHVIHGGKLIQLGPINDERTEADKDGVPRMVGVDQTTLEQLLELGSRSNTGVKARFAHPNMSNDGIGSHLGRWRNLRIEGDALRGDLYLSPASFKSPRGDLGNYVLDLAEDDAESFGVSSAGYWDRETMAAAEPMADGRLAIRFTKLAAFDVVDEPASTRGGLLSLQTGDVDDPRQLPDMVTAILDTHFADAPRHVVEARFQQFLDRFFGPSTHGEKPMADPNPTVGGEKPEAKPTPTPSTPAAASETPPKELAAAPAPLMLDGKPATREEVLAALGIDPAAAPPKQKTAAELAADSAKQIAALCQQHGCPEKTAELLDRDFNVEQTRAFLLDRYTAGNRNVEPGNDPPPSGGDAASDENLGREYDKDAALHRRCGVSREAYIESRKVSLGKRGLIELQHTGAA